MTEMVLIESQGSALLAHTQGRGMPIVFVHAAVCDSRMWFEQMSHLAKSNRVIAYDRPGFGGSPARVEDSSSITDLQTVLAALGVVEPVLLIACSQGGRIALDAALIHPSQIRGLFLIAPSLSGAPSPTYPPEIEEMLRTQQAAQEAEDWARLNEIKARLWLDGPLSSEMRVGGDARRLFLAMNAIAIANRNRGGESDSHAVYDRLADIRCPARVIWGDLDFPHIQQRAKMAADQLPNGDGLCLPGMGHLPSLECADAVNRLLEEFLAEV